MQGYKFPFSRVCSIIIHSFEGEKSEQAPAGNALVLHLTHKYAPPPRFLFRLTSTTTFFLSFPLLLVPPVTLTLVTHTLRYSLLYLLVNHCFHTHTYTHTQHISYNLSTTQGQTTLTLTLPPRFPFCPPPFRNTCFHPPTPPTSKQDSTRPLAFLVRPLHFNQHVC